MRGLRVASAALQAASAGGPGPADRPRPPADVLGGDWSVWLVAAAAVIVGVLVGGAVLAYRRWRKGAGDRRPAPAGPPPRKEALRELDRIRDRGWHRNGRVADFYGATTDVLRRFAARVEPAWPTALTSRELVARMEERWGRDRVADLGPAVEAAERAKFSGERREPETAEDDWRTIRRWIRDAPGAG